MKKQLLCLMAITAACHALTACAQGTSSGNTEIAQGKQVYDKWCVYCHGTGIGLGGGALPGTQQLAIKYRDTDIPAVLDQRTNLTPEFIEVIVREGVSFMPQFRKTEVSDADLAVLNAYLTRNNPGNQ